MLSFKQFILKEFQRKYSFAGKCNDTDDGDLIYAITKYDDWASNEYSIADEALSSGEIKILSKNEFNKIVNLNEPRPKDKSIEYYAHNTDLDIYYILDDNGIHWFYTTSGRIDEDKINKEDKSQTIAIVPGSFKPPHAGHLDMVKQYSDKANKVIVIISDPKKSVRKTSTGKVITPEVSKEIWDLYIDKLKPKNVEVAISNSPSPITAAFDYAEKEIDDGNTVIFGASKKDGDFKRWKSAKSYFEKKRPNLIIADPEENAVEPYENISASDIRANIDNPEAIRAYFPKELSTQDFKKIIDILS